MTENRTGSSLIPLRFWIDYGNKIVVMRVYRLDLLTYWKKS